MYGSSPERSGAWETCAATACLEAEAGAAGGGAADEGEGDDEDISLSATASIDATLSSVALAGARRSLAHERIGRHLVIGLLGRGGMGAVYAAYDPQLDRKLAIKLILGHTGPLEQARLQREAQAMARLTHPRVVAVHDVGVQDGELYIAMQYVEGTTLRGWLEAQPRSVAEICAVFRQAGEGLVAAHEGGVIHRDFKPDNVLVGRRGAVKVTDFGLARATDADELEPTADAGQPLHFERSSLTSPLTRAGAIMGTPAYMAPEQFAASATDERTDQFSFCVALYEALWGERPFGGDTFEALSDAVKGGRRRPRPRDSEVPEWIFAIVDRGLRVAPEERWPSMAALLEALASDPTRARRRRAGLAAAAGLVALAIGVLGVGQVRTERRCEAEGSAASLRWTTAARAEAGAAFTASSAAHAEGSRERLFAALDRWVEAWGPQRAELCRLAADGDAQAELRGRCLDAGLEELGVMLEFVREGGPRIVDAAVDLGASLPRIERCADRIWLAEFAASQSDAQASAQLSALQLELWQAGGLALMGRYAEGAELASSVAARSSAARGQGFRGLALAAEIDAAEMSLRGGDSEAARVKLEAAYFAAAAGGRAREAADAAAVLVYLESSHGEPARALEWARHQEIYIERLGGGESEAARQLHARRAIARMSAGDYEGAREDLDTALELAVAADGAAHPSLYSIYNNVALLAKETRDVEGARAAGERAVAFAREAYGVAHPELATALIALGGAQFAGASYDEARASFEQALDIYLDTLGPTHPNVATPYNNLAAIHYKQGRYRDAVAMQQRALAIREAEYGPEHAQVGSALSNLGAMQDAMGDEQASLVSFERALAIREAQLGAEHSQLAGTLVNMAWLLVDLEQLERAAGMAARAVKIRSEAFGEHHARTASARHVLGVVLRERGEIDGARAEILAAAAALREALGEQHPDHVDMVIELVRVELAGGRLEAGSEALARARALAAGSLPAEDLRHVELERLTAELELARGHGEEALRSRELALQRAQDSSLAQPELLEELRAQLEQLRAK